MSSSRKGSWRRVVVSLALGGSVLQLGFLPDCTSLLRVFNPCGSILGFCEPEDLDLMLADGIPDFDLDPTCTIPFATGGNCAGGPIWLTPGPRP